jgi:hypothetical protein
MPRLEVPIGLDGPIIDVRTWIGIDQEDALDAKGMKIPPVVSLRALVDTGARLTAIQRAWAEAIGLPRHDWVMLKSSVLGHEERHAPVYQLRMTFGALEAPDAPKWRNILVAGVNVVSPGAVVLVGQDLLATCRFTYDGRKRRLMMSY